MTQLTNEQQKYLMGRIRGTYDSKMSELKANIVMPRTMNATARQVSIQAILDKAGVKMTVRNNGYDEYSIAIEGEPSINEFFDSEKARRDKVRKELTALKDTLLDQIVLNGELGELQKFLSQMNDFNTGVTN